MNDFFISNRKKLTDSLENNSIVVLFAGSASVKRGDEKYPFSPDRNFYYMTGIDSENIILTVCIVNGTIEECIYIERFDELKAKWTGPVMLPDEVSMLSGIDNVKYIDEFMEDISISVFNKRIKNIYLDLENRYFNFNSPALDFADKINKFYPALIIKDIYPFIADFRTVKESFEVDNIKKAVNITKDAFYYMMKNTKSDMMEYEIEAYFDFELKKNGVKDKAFNTIAASGKNAAVIHYSSNNSKACDDDLILVDAGAQFGYYSADITRTFPVNGKFSDRQRLFYDIVLNGQQAVIDMIKPDVEFKSLNKALIDYYFTELKKIGLVNSIDEVRNYYYHGVSHFLGLETHDAGRHNEGYLKAGMVLTVEPGIYIANENIGIRIEDDVLVTDNGCEVISKDIIKTAYDIEKFMRG